MSKKAKTKKFLSTVAASAMILGTVATPAVANPGDYYLTSTHTTYTSAAIQADPSIRNVLRLAAPNDVLVDFSGSLLRYTDANTLIGQLLAQHQSLFQIGTALKATNSASSSEDVSTYTGATTALSVASVRAINSTLISVTFSNDVTQNFTVSTLQSGANTITVTYLGINYEVELTYTPGVVGNKAAVTGVQFVDYRHLQVMFSDIVEEDSATDPANYYFEISDGNAGYSANNRLEDALNFAEIGGTADNLDLVASEVAGKTVVDIYFPEDARFTNVLDLVSKEQNPLQGYGVMSDDDERTLIVDQNLSGILTSKALIKNVNVNVAVRNVRDRDLIRQIDTKVFSVKILDEKKPVKVEVNVVGEATSVGAVNNTVTMKTDDSESLIVGYDEPVFDTHGLLAAGVNARDLQLYVDGKLVASQSGLDQDDQPVNRNLADYLIFNMDSTDSYLSASDVQVNVKAAILAVDEKYEALKSHTIAIKGVTDLAGNMGEDVILTVKLVDPTNVTPPPVVNLKPAALDVKQVADNVFRVYFNRVDIESGTLDIDNADGEGGKLLAIIPDAAVFVEGPVINGVQSFSTDITVRAVDSEDIDVNGFNNDVIIPDMNVLAYDNQDNLLRKVRVIDISAPGLTVPLVYGDNYTYGTDGTMKIQKDVLAPTIVTPAGIAYADRADTMLTIDLKDQKPWAGLDRSTVQALTYAYDAASGTFETLVNNYLDPITGDITPTSNSNYLPIEVSYVDKTGAKHVALTSNVELKDNALPNAVDNSKNIDYDYDNDTLIIDLANYKGLLDAENNLVEGVTYSVSIPKGFFSDNELTFSDEADVTAPILDVANGRKAHFSNGSEFAGVGFTTPAMSTTFAVGAKPPVVTPPADDAVPQTTKELISYDKDKNVMTVEFTGQLNSSNDFAANPGSVKNPANYIFNGKSLKAWDSTATVDYVVDNQGTVADLTDDRKFAEFELPTDSVAYDGDIPFTVQNVTNLAGGTMTKIDTIVYVLDNTRPVVIDAVMSGDKQIVLTVNEPAFYLVDDMLIGDEVSAARNFTVKAGNTPLTVNKAVIDINNKRTITLDLGSVIIDGALTVTIGNDQNGNILIVDKNDNPLINGSVITVRRP